MPALFITLQSDKTAALTAVFSRLSNKKTIKKKTMYTYL